VSPRSCACIIFGRRATRTITAPAGEASSRMNLGMRTRAVAGRDPAAHARSTSWPQVRTTQPRACFQHSGPALPRGTDGSTACLDAILRERDRRGLLGREETIGTFATRWPDDYRRGKGGRLRSESTAEHNRERVRRFGQEHAARTLRSITRTDARAWANNHPSTVPALRAMFSDAVADKLADDNPFARLGLATGRGRGEIIVLTREEVHDLAELARRHYGARFGSEIEALILWGA
jgi:hypothetical protein